MPTPEELAAQEAAQKAEADRVKAEAEAKAKADLESIPEAFRGKSQKEIVELLLNTSTELEKHKGTLKERELEIAQLRPKLPADQLSETERKALKEREFISDPVGYLEKHHAERMKPMADEYYKNQADVAFQLVKSNKENYPEFNTLEKQVKGYLDQMPVEVRANPMAIDWAYKMAEYPELKRQVKEGLVRAGLHTQGGGNPSPEPQKKLNLDDDEKVVARRFGMTDEEYIKYSGKGSIDDFK